MAGAAWRRPAAGAGGRAVTVGAGFLDASKLACGAGAGGTRGPGARLDGSAYPPPGVRRARSAPSEQALVESFAEPPDSFAAGRRGGTGHTRKCARKGKRWSE